MNRIYKELGLDNQNMNKKLKEYKQYKLNICDKFGKKRSDNFRNKDATTFGDKIKKIKLDILQDINESKDKQERDIIILIDFNLYTFNEENLASNACRIDAYIEESKVILNNYLSLKDRFGLFIYLDDYKIICPLTYVETIDDSIFSKDIFKFQDNYKKEKDEFSISLKEFNDNDNFF